MEDAWRAWPDTGNALVRTQHPAEVAAMERAFAPKVERPLETFQRTLKAPGLTMTLDYTNLFRKPAGWNGVWESSTTPTLKGTQVDLTVAARPGTLLEVEIERVSSWRGPAGEVQTVVQERATRFVKVDASGKAAVGDLVAAVGGNEDLRVRVSTLSASTLKATRAAVFSLPARGIDF